MARPLTLRGGADSSALRDGSVLRGFFVLAPVAPTIEECVNLSLALLSFIQDPSGHVSQEGDLELGDMALPLTLVPSGFMNLLVAIAASGFLSDPNASHLALEDLVRARTFVAPSGFRNPEVITTPSGFVRDPSSSKPSLWDI